MELGTVAAFVPLSSRRGLRKARKEGRLTSQQVKRDGVGAMSMASSPASVVTTLAVSSGGNTMSEVVAKVLGYCMGLGALALYFPVILKLRREESADGMSLQTWVFNILGFTVGCLYPLKKGFPFSTYVDGVVLTTESLVVMGLVCHYRGLMRQCVIGMVAYLLSIFLVITYLQVPEGLLTAMQIASITMCNYANVPQIIDQFRAGKASWSWITAAMSTTGNGIKIFATKTLSGDPIIVGGHFVGFVTNAILLAQTVFLGKGTAPAPATGASREWNGMIRKWT